MRTFVISDIHGNYAALINALIFVDLQKSDKLILLGDYIDRGPDSKAVLDKIISLKEENFDLICLRGNHEQMLLDGLQDQNALNSWLFNGGAQTLSSFLTSSVEKIPNEYIKLIQSFGYYYEMDQFIFVHAALNMHLPDPFSDYESMLWERNANELLNEKWLGNRILIHGHTPTTRTEIMQNFSISNPIKCIDNGSFSRKPGYGSLCILELETRSINFINEN